MVLCTIKYYGASYHKPAKSVFCTLNLCHAREYVCVIMGYVALWWSILNLSRRRKASFFIITWRQVTVVWHLRGNRINWPLVMTWHTHGPKGAMVRRVGSQSLIIIVWSDGYSLIRKVVTIRIDPTVIIQHEMLCLKGCVVPYK